MPTRGHGKDHPLFRLRDKDDADGPKVEGSLMCSTTTIWVTAQLPKPQRQDAERQLGSKSISVQDGSLNSLNHCAEETKLKSPAITASNSSSNTKRGKAGHHGCLIQERDELEQHLIY